MDKTTTFQRDPLRELDAEIAVKVYGYTLDYEFEEMNGFPSVKELRDVDNEWGYLPDFSTIDSDAFALVDHLISQLSPMGHRHLHVEVFTFDQYDIAGWKCTLIYHGPRPEGFVRAMDEPDRIMLPRFEIETKVVMNDRTRPLAICRAALLLAQRFPLQFGRREGNSND